MAITLPLPVRLAAGILGAGIDLLRTLPDEIPAIPVTIVGNAMRLSMKVQQEIAALATRGDELLGGVIGVPQESPTWAKFDDDEPAQPVTAIKPAGRIKPSTDSGSGKSPANRPAPVKSQPQPRKPARADHPQEATPPPGPAAASPALIDDDQPSLTTPEATAMPPVTTTAMDAAIEVPLSVVESAIGSAEGGAAEDGAPNDGSPSDGAARTADLAPTLHPMESSPADPAAEPAELLIVENVDEFTADPTDGAVELTELLVVQEVNTIINDDAAATLPENGGLSTEGTGPEVDSVSDLTDDSIEPVIIGETEELTAAITIPDELIEEVEAAADGPSVLPDYDRMTLAQVRGHLRELSSADVSELLRYEQDGDNRAPFLTLLSNRLVTLDAQNT